MAEIKRVAVIGAGVMGAGIAAHVANAGIPVILLDIVPKDGTDRDAIAKGAVEKMLKTDPAPFMSGKAARLVETGNIEDHLGKLADCDLIIEAIIERLDLKQALYDKIEKDPRHKNSRILHNEPAKFRTFGRWSMGMTNLENRQADKYDELLAVIEAAKTDRAIGAASPAVTLLKLFRN